MRWRTAHRRSRARQSTPSVKWGRSILRGSGFKALRSYLDSPKAVEDDLARYRYIDKSIERAEAIASNTILEVGNHLARKTPTLNTAIPFPKR